MGIVRIGGGQGFYGDGVQPVGDVLSAGVDYLVCEALAELNRIVARHGRGLDAAEPATRVVATAESAPRRSGREESPVTNGASRPEPVRGRADITGVNVPVAPARRAEAPTLSPVQAGGGPAGSDPLVTISSGESS